MLRDAQPNIKGPMAWKSHFMRFSNINMSSPSLPMVPQWLKLAFGVKRALGVLLAFGKNGGSSVLIWNVVSYVVT